MTADLVAGAAGVRVVPVLDFISDEEVLVEVDSEQSGSVQVGLFHPRPKGLTQLPSHSIGQNRGLDVDETDEVDVESESLSSCLSGLSEGVGSGFTVGSGSTFAADSITSLPVP